MTRTLAGFLYLTFAPGWSLFSTIDLATLARTVGHYAQLTTRELLERKA